MGWKTKRSRVHLGHMKSSLKEIIISGTFTIKITGQMGKRKSKSIKMGSTRNLEDTIPPEREKVNRRNDDTLRRWKSSPILESEIDRNEAVEADKDTMKTFWRRKNKRQAPPAPKVDAQKLDSENRQCPPSPVDVTSPQESMSSDAMGQDSRYTVVTSSSSDDHYSTSTLPDTQDCANSDSENQQKALSDDADANRCVDNEPASPVSDFQADQPGSPDTTDVASRQTEYTPVDETGHPSTRSNAPIRNPHDAIKPDETCGSVYSDNDEHDLEPQAQLSAQSSNPEASVTSDDRGIESDDSVQGDSDKSDSSYESHSRNDPVDNHLAIMPYNQSYGKRQDNPDERNSSQYSLHSGGPHDECLSQLCNQEYTSEYGFQNFDAKSTNNQMAVNTTRKDKHIKKKQSHVSPKNQISGQNVATAEIKESQKGGKTSLPPSTHGEAGTSQASKPSPSTEQSQINTNSNWTIFGPNATLSNVTIGSINIQPTSPAPGQNQTTGGSHPIPPDRHSKDFIYQNIYHGTEPDIQFKFKK